MEGSVRKDIKYHLFTSLVSPNFVYGLPVYGASEPDLNIIKNFLDRCHKRPFNFLPHFN